MWWGRGGGWGLSLLLLTINVHDFIFPLTARVSQEEG